MVTNLFASLLVGLACALVSALVYDAGVMTVILAYVLGQWAGMALIVLARLIGGPGGRLHRSTTAGRLIGWVREGVSAS